MSRFFDDKVLSDDQICEETCCDNGQVSPESRYNDYRNRLPFHYIEDGENDGYYYWTYGATMELSIILSDDVACGEDPQPTCEIAVDDKLSETSKNPVQNKVITEALNGKLNKSTEETVLDQAYIKTAAGDNSKRDISIEQLPLTLVERDIQGHVMTSEADSEGQAVPYEQFKQLEKEQDQKWEDFGLTTGDTKYSIVQKRIKSDGSTVTTKAYQRGSFSIGGNTQAGKSFEEWKVENPSGTQEEYEKTYSYAFAQGDSTKALGRTSVAFGTSNIAQGDYSFTAGINNTARGHGSAALGDATNANGLYSHSEGVKTTAEEVGSHAEGNSTQALGEYSHSEGFNTIAKGNNSHAEGYATNANGLYSHSEGGSNQADGLYAHSEGRGTAASGAASHSEGDGNKALGGSSHAEGNDTQAKGDASHSEGTNTVANGTGSHAEGNNTLADNMFAHAEGNSTKATGLQSHAEGSFTEASGASSHAAGSKTIAAHFAEAAFGTCNESKDGMLFSVGCGTDENNRKNALEVFDTGKVAVQTEPKDAEDVVRLTDLNKAFSDLNIENGTGDYSLRQKYFVNGIDYSAKASGINAVALGGKRYDKLDDASRTPTSADGNQSFSAGGSVHAHGDFSVALGKDTDSYQRASFAMGGGTKAGLTEDEFNEKYHSGKNTSGETYENSYSYAVAFGELTKSDGRGSAAFGSSTYASGEQATAFGKLTQAAGDNSFTAGFDNIASGEQATAFGEHNKSTGKNTISVGTYNESIGENSISLGERNISTGKNSLTAGQGNKTDNINAVAIGFSNIANGDSSIAAGQGNETVNAGSFALGIGNKAWGTGEFVIGKYADNAYSDNKMFSVGAGESDTDRKTIFTVLKDGRAQVAGAPRESWDVVRKTELDATNTSLESEVTRATQEESKIDSKLDTEITRAKGVESTLTTTINSHINNKENPHSVTKSQVGLGDVDNTADKDKPISTAQQSALDKKYDKTGGTIGGDVVITGDLTVNGTEHINNTENLAVENAMIYSNAKGATLAQLGGIGIKTNATDIYGIVYDPTSDSVKLGLGKSDANGKFTFNANEGEPVAVRDDSSKLTNDHIIKWDSANHKLVDSGKSITDIDNAITAVDGKVSTETTARETADKKLQENITTETTNRTNADNALQTKIETEATTRKNADDALTAKFDDYVTLDTEQTISGKKTFGTETHFNGVTEHYGNVNITDYVLKVLDTNKDFVTQYSADDIVTENGDKTYTRTLPLKSGTLAVTSDITDEIGKVNIKNGKGTSSIQQPADPKYNGVIKAATKNPYAKVLYPALTDAEPLGAIGDYAASFGGNSSVQAKRGIGGGTSSVTKGAYSQSLGDNTVTTPNASDSTAIGYQTTTDAPSSFTHGAYTVVMSQKYVEGMFDPNAEPGQPGQPTEPGTTPADTLAMDSRRGEAASAGGFNCYSSGFAAQVDGVSNVADGHISKSSGRSNRSWSYLSKTDGYQSLVKPDDTDTDATGEGSWANGDNVQIIGAKYAYAGGSHTTVSKGANYSFSHGLGLYASNEAQAVFGQYNVGDDVSQFIVGVGTSDTERKNAFQVLKDGQVLANTAPTNPNAVIRKQEFDAEHLRTWFTINDTNTNLNRVNEESYKKVGGQISGNVYITGTLTVDGKTQVKTAPTENNDVLRYQDIAIEVETALLGA